MFRRSSGFTLVELIVVIIILGVLAVTAIPRFVNVSTDAKIASLNNIAGQIRATNKLIQYKATIAGLKPRGTDPNAQQADYVVDFGFGATEVSWNNLCAEAVAEFGDRLNFFDFMNISTDNFETSINNQYASIGYNIPTGGAPSNSGCYVYYNSFDINCTVTVVDTDC